MQTDKLIDRIEDILKEVGATLLAMRAKGLVKGIWHSSQLKSEADLIAERMILDRLRDLSPGLPIVSEEDQASHDVNRFARYWLVDPIDGTASFCGGYSGFVTQIALMEGAHPVLGAVYSPALDIMYLAEQGSGATANGTKLSVSLKEENIILIDNYPEPQGIAQFLYEKLPCISYIESGSIGLKICRVADGQANLFVKNVKVKDWDLAPGQLVLSEAGGVLVDLHGKKISYNGSMEQSGGLIAAASQGIIDKVRMLAV